MARYIDTSKVTIPKGFFEDLNVPKLLNWLNNQPTADVVPKSEVQRIFEELYKSVVSKIPPHIRPIFKDDMDFEDGFRNGKTDALLDVLVLIAELEKKYLEESICDERTD